MKKRFISIIVCLLLMLTLFPFSAGAVTNNFPSGNIDSPKNIGISITPDDTSIYSYTLGFSIPSSVAAINDEWMSWSQGKDASEMSINLEYDYKYNENGNWHYTSNWDFPDGALESIKLVDFGTNGLVYIKPATLSDISDKMSMLDANTVYFRSRFTVTFYDGANGVTVKTVSPWSETAAIGKNANAVDKNVEPPVLTKAVLKKDDIGAPYFEISNQIPDSVKTLDNNGGAINIGIEYRINGGSWKVQTGYSRLEEVFDVKTENIGLGNDIM
jgi:hypothetical protein